MKKVPLLPIALPEFILIRRIRLSGDKASPRQPLYFFTLPNVLLADFGWVRQERPDLLEDQRGGDREYNPPNISLSGSFVLRYMIKEPKRRKRK